MTEFTFTLGMLVGIFVAIPVLLVVERWAPRLVEKLNARIDKGKG